MLSLLSDDNATRLLPIAGIRRDGGTQPRGGLNEATVQRYVDDLNAGAKFPPVDVVFDDKDYWLWDGFHRIEAHLRAQRTEILVIQRKGTLKDAQWNSFGANKDHGLPRTNEEKERAIRLALQHPNADGMTAVALARHLGVSDKTVTKYREQMQAVSEIPTLNTREGADGKQYPAKRPKPNPTQPAPTARPLSDEETRHLVWRTIKAEVEIAPSATAVFRWQRYLDWLARHSEPKHFKPHLIDATRSIDGQLLVNATITVGMEIERNLEIAKRAAQPTQPNPPAVVGIEAPSINLGPGTLPADLIARGWELRQMAASGRWWCHNANGPRATSPYDTIAEAATAARGMQIDVARPATKPAATDEVTMALQRIEESVGVLVERLGLDMLRVRLDERQGNPWSLLASKGSNELNWSHGNIVGVSSALINLGRKVAK